MRFSFALPLILSLALAPSAFAAQKHGAKAPDKPLERVYLETEVTIDEVYQFARDKDGLPISGTIQSFYPNGRLAWETQWVNGKLHGTTRGYYENRKMKEETTWMNGKLNGPAK
jgi:antitoxin component YwqK of YwqJK toxin-antitoxin module